MNAILSRLKTASANLRTAVLLVEDGEADLPLEAVEELRRIEGYLDRISARIEPARPQIERPA